MEEFQFIFMQTSLYSVNIYKCISKWVGFIYTWVVCKITAIFLHVKIFKLTISKTSSISYGANSLACFQVDTDGPHVVGGGELLDQLSQVTLHKFAAGSFQQSNFFTDCVQLCFQFL